MQLMCDCSLSTILLWNGPFTDLYTCNFLAVSRNAMFAVVF